MNLSYTGERLKLYLKKTEPLEPIKRFLGLAIHII
jgi:hypothetical protein